VEILAKSNNLKGAVQKKNQISGVYDLNFIKGTLTKSNDIAWSMLPM